MAEQLTKQQEMAVYNRGGNLLISAAAGSGKTKVLVDRLLSYLTDPKDPADLDEFLIITYTKAAAAELRGKIAAKLTQRIALDPDNRHLQRQMQRLYLTKVSTVHAFCGDLLREYAYMLDLPADFRVADEKECQQLRETVMAQVLDDAYASVDDDSDFRSFVDTQGLGRDDRLVPEILMKVYDSARCHLLPEEWLNNCVRNAETEGLSDVSQTIWGQFLVKDLKEFLGFQIEAIAQCAELAEKSEEMEKQAQLLRDTQYQLQALADSETWDEILRRKEIQFGTLRFSKKCLDLELADRIKAVRAGCKKALERKLKSFTDSSDVLLEDMQGAASSIRGMIQLVRKFEKAFAQAKRSRRMLDFGDLEHKTLDLLLGKKRGAPTAIAAEIAGRFREIMVDEYQDSNGVQDAIFAGLTGKRQNCFMVGDVKQSIYQFRLADPGIFLEKYEAYEPAENAEPGKGRKVLLTRNFRSGGAVLAAANDVFKTCMSPRVGGLAYGDNESLVEGIPHDPLGEPEVELWTIPVERSQYEEEAALVANRIRELTDGSHFFRGEKGMEPIKPEHIAILLRSPGSSGRYFQDALNQCGIRCSGGGGTDLLQTEDVSTLRALLQIISNPRQDIPLIAALTSPVFGFTADELASFRAKRRWGSVYEALIQEPSDKAVRFLEVLKLLRKKARMDSLTHLIETIFTITQLDSLYGAMADGENRQINLQSFYQMAMEYESSGRKDLEQFLEYLDAMEEKGLSIGNEGSTPGAVTLMSIHKSKGLEFPVVFVCGLSKVFNRESARGQVLCDQKLGIGLTAVDSRNRVRYPTVAKRAIALKTVSDSLSEEMRVLYVALTRARDRLIMTYASASLENDLRDLVLRMDVGRKELLTSEVVCPGEWVLLAALRRSEAGELFSLSGRPAETHMGTYPWLIRVQGAPEVQTVSEEPQHSENRLSEKLYHYLQQGLNFSYPYAAATGMPSKQTATQRKGREKDAEAAENTSDLRTDYRNWRKPSFALGKPTGAERGKAMHAVMQYIRFDACKSADDVRCEVRRLVGACFITPEQAELIDCEGIASFFRTELGERILTAKEVIREFKFSILDAGENYDAELKGEQILLQGVVDCAILEENGITLVDFKTDRISQCDQNQMIDQYTPQVCAYADALSRIYEKPINAAYLYFFHTNALIQVKIS